MLQLIIWAPNQSSFSGVPVGPQSEQQWWGGPPRKSETSSYVLESTLWLAAENAGMFAISRQVWLPQVKVSRRLRVKVQGGKDGAFSFRLLLFNFTKKHFLKGQRAPGLSIGPGLIFGHSERAEKPCV